MELENTRTRLSDQQQSLVLEYRQYARRLSSKYFHRAKACGYSAEEVESAATYGLCVSALRYRNRYGSKFSTYAYVRINGEVRDLLRGRRRQPVKPEEPVNQGLTVFEGACRVAANYEAFENGLGIKVFTAITPNSAEHQHQSITDHTPECMTAQLSARQLINQALKTLSADAVYLIEQHYFAGRSMESIQSDLGLTSRSAIFRLHRKTLHELRAIFKRQNLKLGDFLSSLN